MHNFKKLNIWKKATALSVVSTVAEGAGRNSDKEVVQLIGIANGSYFDTQTRIIIKNCLKFINESVSESIINKLNEIQKMNRAFQKQLKISKV
jgi:four helix bundle protein